jgi:TRAP-type C4-dicarboxylate transport system substrate-binding protein
MPVSQLPESLSKSVVDGAVIPWEVALPLRIHELVKHHAEFEGGHGLYGAAFIFAMNKRRYQSLAPELKQVIDANSGAALAKQIGRLWDEAEEAGRAAARARGNSFTRIGGAEAARWRKEAEPVLALWKEDMRKRGLDGEKLHADAAQLVEQFTGKQASP